MMIRHFANMVREVEVTKYQPGRRVDGDWEKGEAVNETRKMIAIPITPAQLKQLPEGKYKAGDMRFYRKGTPVYRADDVITFNEVKYKIGDISDRAFDGNYTMYLAKREYDQSEEN